MEELVRQFKKEWEVVRKPFENALVKFIHDIGSPGTNVYIKTGMNKKFASGYFHNDNQVRVIFRDLILEALPKCLWPDVKFTLASNVLKLSSTLSEMIIHADYVLIRNESDIIHYPKDQDPYKSSPFLFEQVHDVGKVAIRMDGCELKGFLTLGMDIDEINFGYDRFTLNNCLYTIEIYRPGDESPPVIATYNFSNIHQGLGLTDLVKTPLLTYSLVPKLQGAIYSFVNTSVILRDIREYRIYQEIVLMLNMHLLSEVVRLMNKLTVEKNNGAIEMADYEVHWADRRIKPSKKNEAGCGESLRLTQMVLTGLDTLYSAHIGGPLEFDTVRIVEKLRFSSLQVRGKLEIISTWSDIFDFAAEISDLTVDLHIELLETKNISKSRWIKDRKLQVEGLRKIVFTVPTLIFGSAESLIGGYLLKEVPKLINSHVMAMFDQAMQAFSETKPNLYPQITPEAGALAESKYEVDDLVMTENDYEIPNNELLTMDGRGIKSESDNTIERDKFKKNKKRFKNPDRPSRNRRRGRTSVSV